MSHRLSTPLWYSRLQLLWTFIDILSPSAIEIFDRYHYYQKMKIISWHIVRITLPHYADFCFSQTGADWHLKLVSILAAQLPVTRTPHLLHLSWAAQMPKFLELMCTGASNHQLPWFECHPGLKWMGFFFFCFFCLSSSFVFTLLWQLYTRSTTKSGGRCGFFTAQKLLIALKVLFHSAPRAAWHVHRVPNRAAEGVQRDSCALALRQITDSCITIRADWEYISLFAGMFFCSVSWLGSGVR